METILDVHLTSTLIMALNDLSQSYRAATTIDDWKKLRVKTDVLLGFITSIGTMNESGLSNITTESIQTYISRCQIEEQLKGFETQFPDT